MSRRLTRGPASGPASTSVQSYRLSLRVTTLSNPICQTQVVLRCLTAAPAQTSQTPHHVHRSLITHHDVGPPPLRLQVSPRRVANTGCTATLLTAAGSFEVTTTCHHPSRLTNLRRPFPGPTCICACANKLACLSVPGATHAKTICARASTYA